jgi:hypothetical protein
VLTVADPGLPDPPAPAIRPVIKDSAALARMAEKNAAFHQTRMAFASATVYDGNRSLLRVSLNGDKDKEVSVWSNVDFNHFAGFGCFEARDGSSGDVRKYNLFISTHNENTVLRAQRFAARGIAYTAPMIPLIPDGAPAYVIVTENPDAQSLKLVEDMHALYRAEGLHMAEAQAVRQREYEERKAFLLAHPPVPQDVTVHFWQRSKEEETETEKGGNP